ncbi:MAG: VanZ family protein [Acidobacteriota bacterium]
MASVADPSLKRDGWLRHLGLWLPPLLYMAAIFFLSSESDPVPQVTTHVWDKALHFVEYGGLALLLCRGLRGEGIGWTAALVMALVATSAYGASDEWHQSFTPGRSSDVRDWMADSLGAAIGLAATALVARPLSRKMPPRKHEDTTSIS